MILIAWHGVRSLEPTGQGRRIYGVPASARISSVMLQRRAAQEAWNVLITVHVQV